MPDGAPDSRSPRDPRESADRVSVSAMPQSAEALTGRHSRAPAEDLPPRSAERLLSLWMDLPVTSGDRGGRPGGRRRGHASLLPDSLVAACLVPASGGAQEIVRAADTHDDGEGAGTANPARLFAWAPYERAITVEPGGSTLHLGGDDPSYEEEQSPAAALLERAAAVARRGLELARMQERAAGALAEARSLNAHIAQQEKLASLGQIVAGVVHELNNPLTSIVAYTDYLIRRANVRPSGPDADEIDRLRRISDSAGRMLRFTRDLVSYARPSSETPVQVSVHLVIDQAIAFCEHVLAGANVTVDRRFASHLPPVRGKPEQLAQIFVNLITNACHAMATGGGILSVTTREDPGLVCIALSDSGHGIHADHMPQVFTPFFTTKTSGAGTGLGLAIVKSILDGHGGTIRATSEPGDGATFEITLPAWTR